MIEKTFRKLSALLFMLLFPLISIAQTVAEKYNFDFMGGKQQKWTWVQRQACCFSYIDSTQMVSGGDINYKVAYTPSSRKGGNMVFIASCTIILPEQVRGENCQVSIKSKTKEISNAWVMVTALNCNEEDVLTDSKRLEHSEWTENVVSLKLMNGRNTAVALRINIHYFGNNNPEQQICLSDLQIKIDEKDLGKAAVEDQSLINNNANKQLIKNKIIKLSHDNDSTLLVRMDELKDKRIIGLGECTHGSRELKTAFIQFSKNLIQNGNCKIVLMEAPVSVLLLVDLYIQGIVSSPNIEKQVEEIMQMFYADYTLFMDFVKWLKKYNETSLRKVHLSGMDYSESGISPYFYDYLLALLGKEKGRFYLLNLYNKKYNDILQYALNDSYLKKKLGDENFTLFVNFIETCAKMGIGSDLPTPDSRDFYMFTYIQRIADHFLKENEKLIVNGHSMHLSSLENFDGFPYKCIPAGNRLKKYYGDKYYSINFQVGEGTFTQESSVYLSELMPLSLSKPPYDSFEHLALNTKVDYFYYPSKYLKEDVAELLVIPRMTCYRDQYQFHSVKKWCDAYVFIRQSTPLKNVVFTQIDTIFAKFLMIDKLIKELKANQ